ncbi:tRNA lysidine(34) synthetase TilS [Treponema phagedenis]|uniref:tRNA(Ile)-lysidine synthase n=1 Tax=Treponema phagedenis TaxID=162 RepID=A0A0B7GWN7_TREPH|nr:tRNA lysidine(34) synthetase TilS [Treponema phagedenis]EFW38636.1 tRNA(Ile)-lysidine synthetase [Treponema phagedenis F0421]NVP25085.1 tRNA lysidine(34) synthetase TilS [Treponema phagedenis]QEJ95769.1 tRNA lysidine(34) synthetase TilS [Treponema phagedenis]QEJ97199.1 tRNA lysidine(34) synthetase TilS [Treponema phagedenis]QEK00313.1 tRNA lysidine(34) synthetase TilS [Treponema phagedenis]
MADSLLDAVLQNLSSILKVKKTYRLLIAVSGGADSLALLTALHTINTDFNHRLFVVTVNHNIREKNETKADADFVSSFCAHLQPPVPCIVKTIPAGSVKELASIRKTGTEDAARILRYRAFEEAAIEVSADFILTAHNKNDMYETILMRLFQGGSPKSIAGIPLVRGKYLRPLLTVERASIEAFLRQRNIFWREDKTNFEQVYLRNKIRHTLIPVLHSVFVGWQSGLDTAIARIKADSDYCDTLLEKKQKKANKFWQKYRDASLSLDYAFFTSFPLPLRIRLIQQACNLLEIHKRIPFASIQRLALYSGKKTVQTSGIKLFREKDLLIFSKADTHIAHSQKMGYLLWIEKTGNYKSPIGIFEIRKKSTGIFIFLNPDYEGIGPFPLPLCIRSWLEGDMLTIKGGKKSIKKLFTEWTVSLAHKENMPIIEVRGTVRAIYGKPFGYKNRFSENN